MRFKDKFWLAFWTMVSMEIFYVWGLHQVWQHQIQMQREEIGRECVPFEQVGPSLEKRCQDSRRINQTVLDFCKQTKSGRFAKPADFEQKVHEHYQELLDELEGNEEPPIPEDFQQACVRIRSAYLLDWDSLEILEDAYFNKDRNIKANRFRQALQLATKAKNLADPSAAAIDHWLEVNRSARKIVITTPIEPETPVELLATWGRRPRERRGFALRQVLWFFEGPSL